MAQWVQCRLSAVAGATSDLENPAVGLWAQHTAGTISVPGVSHFHVMHMS